MGRSRGIPPADMMRVRAKMSIVSFMALLFLLSAAPADSFANAVEALSYAHFRPCPFRCEVERTLVPKSPPMSGSDVADLQLRLQQLGIFKGKIDGIYGASTVSAVKLFQRRSGLRENGIVDNGMWARLAAGVLATSGPPSPKPEGKIRLVVNLDRLTLVVYADDRPYKTYPIAIGRWDTPTQIGEFVIIDKGVNPGGPFGSRWIGLNVPWGAYGIHGTDRPWTIGYSASAGCIRMFNQDVEELFEWVDIGTRVIIQGSEGEYQLVTEVERPLKEGDTGKDVRFVQWRLREAGFDPGPLDGWFGDAMKQAVMNLQKFYGLPITGIIGKDELYVLSII